ncbi:WbqC family protein [Actinomadura sp. SCN-SB]|uniref:WbqC family protein n=1 Tax=Actinomadura sp. SCN-SB TaxID=3373092 RepID=UPI003751D720
MRSQVLVPHQPAYLPWAGYFSRLLDVDRLVLLDHVQFTERGWQNRNFIRTRKGERIRLTVPVTRRFGQAINHVQIADPAFTARHWRTIQQAYRRAPYWMDCTTELASIYQSRWDSLAALNLALTRALLRCLGHPIEILRSSELAPEGNSTAMLIDLCRRTGSRVLRVGTGASTHYLDRQLLADSGITVEIAAYTTPTTEEEADRAPVSILDTLVRHGPNTLEILRQGATLRLWTQP